MESIFNFLGQHQVAAGAVAALVFSAAARALPEPKASGNAFYRWFHDFSHLLLANFDKVSK